MCKTYVCLGRPHGWLGLYVLPPPSSVKIYFRWKFRSQWDFVVPLAHSERERERERAPFANLLRGRNWFFFLFFFLLFSPSRASRVCINLHEFRWRRRIDSLNRRDKQRKTERRRCFGELYLSKYMGNLGTTVGASSPRRNALDVDRQQIWITRKRTWKLPRSVFICPKHYREQRISREKEPLRTN